MVERREGPLDDSLRSSGVTSTSRCRNEGEAAEGCGTVWYSPPSLHVPTCTWCSAAAWRSCARADADPYAVPVRRRRSATRWRNAAHDCCRSLTGGSEGGREEAEGRGAL